MIVHLAASVLLLKHSQENQAARTAARCLEGALECFCQLFAREVLQQVLNHLLGGATRRPLQDSKPASKRLEGCDEDDAKCRNFYWDALISDAKSHACYEDATRTYRNFYEDAIF